ncbi:MAG TPA: hypothetical protein VGM13_01290 [Thermoanaerobaculia bacterium]|jgi:hypothetical protein
MRRLNGFLGAAALAASGVLSAQTAALKPVEALPDPVRPVLAEVAYAHPLFLALEEPPKVLERPNPVDLETRVPLVLIARVLETGKVSELALVEPPLKALATPLPALAPRWRYAIPRKGGKPAATWATQLLELNVSLEKPVFSVFQFEPLKKDDPLAKVFRENSGDEWMSRYPAAIDPKDAEAVSVEDLDAPPAAEKTPWSFDATRQRGRITALVEISAQGAVSRVLPTGDAEPLLVRWVRESSAKWKLSPGKAGGKPVASWMTLDATLDYTIDSAKKKGERSVKKNLRGLPPS